MFKKRNEKKSSVTQITRAVTVSRGGAATSARSKHRGNPPYCVQGSWGGREGGCHRFTCAGAKHSCTPTGWNSQNIDGIRGFSCKGPSSSLRLNIVWQQPPQTQTPLCDHLITPPSSPHAHTHSVNQLMRFYSCHCLYR